MYGINKLDLQINIAYAWSYKMIFLLLLLTVKQLPNFLWAAAYSAFP